MFLADLGYCYIRNNSVVGERGALKMYDQKMQD